MNKKNEPYYGLTPFAQTWLLGFNFSLPIPHSALRIFRPSIPPARPSSHLALAGEAHRARRRAQAVRRSVTLQQHRFCTRKRKKCACAASTCKGYFRKGH
jgi:hypothetical protein